MSTGVSVVVIAGGLVFVMLAWIAVTRRRRPADTGTLAVWRRAQGYPIAHAFRVAELDIAGLDAEPLAHCGRWPVAELVIDDDAPRCAPCERAVARMQRRN